MIKLSDWLTRKNLSQRQLGRALGLSSGIVAKYCAGRRPQPEVAAQIFHLTQGQVEPNDFYDIPGLSEMQAAREVVVNAALAVAASVPAEDSDALSELVEAVGAYQALISKLETDGGLEAAA